MAPPLLAEDQPQTPIGSFRSLLANLLSDVVARGQTV